MTDYAAAAVQPIVQGLVTITGNASNALPVFTGRGALITGASPPLPTPGRPVSFPFGVIVLTLDVGLPGNSGAVEPVPNNAIPPTVLPAAPLPRTLITMRSPVAGVATTLDSVSVAYGNFTVPTPMDGSLTQIAITMGPSTGGLLDPVATPFGGPFTGGANGFEIIVWAGVESP
jgi:hypothetical protein